METVGLAHSAQNAIKHGLCSKFTVLESENQDDYNDLLKRFINSEKPADNVEYELVAKRRGRPGCQNAPCACKVPALFTNRTRKKLRAQDKQEMQVHVDQLEKYARYQTMHDRAYDRAANALAKHRKEKAAQERGFVSQKRAEAAEIRKEAQEVRREKHEKQRDELFEIRKSREKINRDLAQIRFLEKFPPEMREQVLLAAQQAA